MLELMPPFYLLTFAKVSVSVSKTFGLKKSLGIGLENIWSRKKSRYQSRKYLVSKKVSVSVSKILVSKKCLGIGLDEIFCSRHSVIPILGWVDLGKLIKVAKIHSRFCVLQNNDLALLRLNNNNLQRMCQNSLSFLQSVERRQQVCSQGELNTFY